MSIDQDISEWKDYLKSTPLSGDQWIIAPAKLKDYTVVTVPRIIIIDRNFKVVDLDGPVPSSKRTISIIDNLLK